jgi:DNA uptake protein ComE-like DNA-binding protein
MKLRHFASFTFVLTTILFASVALCQTTPVPDQSDQPKVTHKMSKSEKSKTALARTGKVDLNTSTKADIAALPGVGPSYAQKIIDARPFVDKNQLLGKKILPGSTYEQIKDKVTVTPPK